MDNPLKAAAAALGNDDGPDRAYRLRADETVPDGIRRIARGQLADAHDELSGAPRRKLAAAVHETRKRLKRLRAGVRLARDAIGEETYARENAAFRAAGRRLAAGRDAQVLLETLEQLRERFADELPEPATAELQARLQDECERAHAALRADGAAVDAVIAELEHAQARTPAWTFECDGFTALSPGLKRIYGRGRKRMRAASADPSAENLHEWRKRVKDLWHATQIVRNAKPKRLKRVSRRAHALADVLGDANDLSMLREYVEAHPRCFRDETFQRGLLAVIDRRTAALRDEALQRGRQLYKRSPKRFVRAIARGADTHADWKPRTRAA